MELWWRLRGATRGVSMLRPKLAKKNQVQILSFWTLAQKLILWPPIFFHRRKEQQKSYYFANLEKKSYSANSKGNARKRQSPTMAKYEWKHLTSPSLECKKNFQGLAPLREGVPTPQIFLSYELELSWFVWKITFFVKKISAGGVPPPYPQITIPNNFSYPHCLFTVTLLWSYGDV